jgi:hypothetical protein
MVILSYINKYLLNYDTNLSYNNTMRKLHISSVVLVLLNVGWYVLAFAIALTLGIAMLSTFHDIGGGELDVPASFSVDSRTLPVSAPSIGIATAQLQHVRGSVKFGQLRAVFRTLRDGRPFVAANADRVRRIAFAVIGGELARAALMYSSHSFVMTHFSANGLRFDARPDVNVITIVDGLIILAIAEVFRTGTRLDEDQSLTI